MKLILAAVAVSALAAGCASRPDDRPVAQRVCMLASQETVEEGAYLSKRAAVHLKDAGFELATQQCDVTVSYNRFGQFQGESIRAQPFWISRSGYWSQEGMVTTRDGNGKILDEDRSVSLRGYSTKQELLDQLAWKIVEPATWYYQPAGAPK